MTSLHNYNPKNPLNSSNQPYIKKYFDSPPTIINKRPSNHTFNLNKTPLNKPNNSIATSNSASSYSWAKNLDFDSIKDPFKKVDKIPQVSPAKIPFAADLANTPPSTSSPATIPPTNNQTNFHSHTSNQSNNFSSSRPIKQPSFNSKDSQIYPNKTPINAPNNIQPTNDNTLHQKPSQLDQLIIAARKKDRNEIYNIKLLEKKEKATQKELPPPFQRHHKIPWVANKSIVVSSIESDNLGLKSQTSQYSDISSSSLINNSIINHAKNLNTDSKLNTPDSLSNTNPNCTNISHITTTNTTTNHSPNINSSHINATYVDKTNLASKKSEDAYNNIIDIYSTDFIYSESPSTPKSKNLQFFSPSNITNNSNTSIFNTSQNFLFSKKSKANLNDSKPNLESNSSNLSFKNSRPILNNSNPISNTKLDNSEKLKYDLAFVTSTTTAPIPHSSHNQTNLHPPPPLTNSNSNKDSKIRSSHYDEDSSPEGCRCACLIM
ncbi:hypothetical protein AYI69_g1990 [Smittium culicis]|uniref:Uncharacterized protein n=1 Tax=Smittium culicis TaxID=133412 RepID=A0A1R1YNS7_9FUNG|nr:hypothetical protein AYI69_g10351 [Smittium culicis]OMJ28533.1 hypothetical protein AYI69_g1990 [Smittium culicis]